MDQQFVIQIAGIIIGGLGTIFLALLVWGLKALITAIFNNTQELAVIQNTLKTLVEDAKSIPKMKEDINALHGRVRDLKSPESKN